MVNTFKAVKLASVSGSCHHSAVVPSISGEFGNGIQVDSTVSRGREASLTQRSPSKEDIPWFILFRRTKGYWIPAETLAD